MADATRCLRRPAKSGGPTGSRQPSDIALRCAFRNMVSIRAVRDIGPRPVVAAALAALATAGCGGGLRATQPLPVRSTPASFNVTLKPQRSPARGVGPSASLSLRLLMSRSEVCWTFSKVVGIAHPTTAFINVGTVGSGEDLYYIPLGGHYAPSGCTKPAPRPLPGATGRDLSASQLLAGLSREPSEYYVEIDERHQPAIVSAAL
jgi:hypothetical protein